MYDKSKYSFLIAWTRQLDAALDEAFDGDDELAELCVTVAHVLDVLEQYRSASDGESAGGDDESIESDDDGRIRPTLGGTLAGPAATSATRAVGRSLRQVGGGTDPGDAGARVVLGSQRRKPALLRKGGKRRGKK